MRRKAFGILFSLLLFAPATCTFMWLQHKKYTVKKEVKQQILKGMNKSELVLFQFSEQEITSKLEWEDDSEFEYQGMMYDVVKRSQHKDIIFLWCWPDREETQLKDAIQKITANIMGSDRENQQQKKNLTNFLKTLYSSMPSDWNSELPKPLTTSYKPFLNSYNALWLSSFFRPPAA